MIQLALYAVAMDSLAIRHASPRDCKHVIRLNSTAELEASPMDRDLFAFFIENCSRFAIAELDGMLSGFCVAFEPGCSYESPNYRWFDSRLSSFLYLDRVIISEQARRLGIASALYSDLVGHAFDREIPFLVAELNVKPRNAPSIAFHHTCGFVRLLDVVRGSEKVVSMVIGASEQVDRALAARERKR